MNRIVCTSVNVPPHLTAPAPLSSWIVPSAEMTSQKSLGQQIALHPAQAAAAFRSLDMATVLDLLYG